MSIPSERLAIATELAAALVASADVRSALRGIDSVDGHPVVAAALDDDMGYVFDQVRAHEHGAYVVTRSNGRLEYIAIRPSVSVESNGHTVCVVDRDTSVETLLGYLRDNNKVIEPGESMPDIAFELLAAD